MVQIPPDYDYVTNDNHIIKPGDYYQRKTWRTGEWYNIKRYSPNFANSSLSTIKYAHYSDLVLISKKTEPRFKTEKPYPFGY